MAAVCLADLAVHLLWIDIDDDAALPCVVHHGLDARVKEIEP
jgi:hypothetical protein